MNLKASATQTFDARQIPVDRQKIIWKDTAQGAVFVIVGIALLCVACKVVLATDEITMMALVLIVLGLGMFGAGWHIASKQVTTEAVKWVTGAFKNVYAAVRGKSGSS